MLGCWLVIVKDTVEDTIVVHGPDVGGAGVSPWPPPSLRPIRAGIPRASWDGRWRGHFRAELGGGVTTDIPIMAVGSGAHPTAVVVAGLHGDEYEAAEAARRTCAELDPARMDGTVVAVLTGNPLAFGACSRTTPPELDGLDLARTFPGDPAGSPTQRLAAELWHLVVKEASPTGLVADLHSGGTHYAYAHLAGYRTTGSPSEQRSRELAQAIGFARLWAMDPTAGTLSTEASLAGIASIGCEVTGGAGLRADDVAAYQDGLHNLLRMAGITHGRAAPTRHADPRRTTTVTAPDDGFAVQLPTLGHTVSQGEPLVVIRDPVGAHHREVAAPHDGEVWATRTCPSVRTGDILALVSRPVDEAVQAAADRSEG